MTAVSTQEESAPTLADVVAVLEEFYPPQTAASWDQVGLVSGDPEQPVHHVRFAVDPTLAVIEAARRDGVDLLVTHHPLLLRGINSVATTSAKGAAVTALVVADLALYCAHTNADLARPGVNDALAAACGLPDDCPPLDEEDGLGRVGELPEPLSLKDFAHKLAATLPPAPVGVRVSGDPDAIVRKIAVLGGAGDDRFEVVRRSGADVYVTADLRHHPAIEAREESRSGPPYLIDAGHWATESLWLAGAADRLRERLAAGGHRVETDICTVRTDPWDFLVAAPTPQGADVES
ncbi:Nif3-like dinuclear metal center hexameric protein [Yimella sp. cx-51]|uniref:Nif3-like dinuclear metal center hexameric protein n=1 Tax=Yimella sp. cx-51 TaxID=2770551 RepID=UPI00165E02C5|nr:Nif3-like dinuclear metal center hexameric protein [Yimella sp. cx-51]MBC9956954.1 Nif3-like dinuclear metal center hexameric protein [Yimella sp. cx-51]QTH39171.1 Nif3-like dinuclear metal center hexameric protein [Yimella sp. cx-51]